MMTLYYRVPLQGVGRVGIHRRAWTIDKVDFPPLLDGAAPPGPEIVEACRKAMRDGDGKAPTLEALQSHDLREGLRAAFRAIETDPAEAASTAEAR